MAWQPNQALLGRIGEDPINYGDASSKYLSDASRSFQSMMPNVGPEEPGKSVMGALGAGVGGYAAGSALSSGIGTLMASSAGAGMPTALGIIGAAAPYALPVIALGAYLFS
jgi:hypothetical protein